MSDNFTTNPGAGGSVFAADDISSVLYPRVKAAWGVDGAAVDASATNPFPVQLLSGTSGGCTPHRLVSAATTNDTNIKAGAGKVWGVFAINLNAAVRYAKFYNLATTPAVGTDTPVLTLPIPADTTGSGFFLSLPTGISFATGIGIGLTTGIADSDTNAVAANEIIVHTFYA